MSAEESCHVALDTVVHACQEYIYRSEDNGGWDVCIVAESRVTWVYKIHTVETGRRLTLKARCCVAQINQSIVAYGSEEKS